MVRRRLLTERNGKIKEWVSLALIFDGQEHSSIRAKEKIDNMRERGIREEITRIDPVTGRETLDPNALVREGVAKRDVPTGKTVVNLGELFSGDTEVPRGIRYVTEAEAEKAREQGLPRKAFRRNSEF